jgi:hypothetical protein
MPILSQKNKKDRIIPNGKKIEVIAGYKKCWYE